MLTEIRELNGFQLIARKLSFAGAARALHVTPSSLSRLISRLEARLGVSLFERTTRNLILTPAGAMFYERSLPLLESLEQAEQSIRLATLAPTGTLRLGAPVPFGQTYLAPLIGSLLARYPGLRVELVLKDSISDMVAEGIDLVVRIGLLTDSRLVVRRLCTNRRILVASPEYLAENGAPKSPKDLAQHVCLPCTYMGKPGEWRLLGPNGVERVDIGGGIASNNVGILVDYASQGLGISVGPTQSIAALVRSGKLVQVLPGYEFERTGVYALYPSRRQLSPKVRAAVDFLSEHFADPAPWDLSLKGYISDCS